MFDLEVVFEFNKQKKKKTLKVSKRHEQELSKEGIQQPTKI